MTTNTDIENQVAADNAKKPWYKTTTGMTTLAFAGVAVLTLCIVLPLHFAGGEAPTIAEKQAQAITDIQAQIAEKVQTAAANCAAGNDHCAENDKALAELADTLVKTRAAHAIANAWRASRAAGDEAAEAQLIWDIATAVVRHWRNEPLSAERIAEFEAQLADLDETKHAGLAELKEDLAQDPTLANFFAFAVEPAAGAAETTETVEPAAGAAGADGADGVTPKRQRQRPAPKESAAWWEVHARDLRKHIETAKAEATETVEATEDAAVAATPAENEASDDDLTIAQMFRREHRDYDAAQIQAAREEDHAARMRCLEETKARMAAARKTN